MAVTVTVDPVKHPPTLSTKSDGQIEGTRFVLVEGLSSTSTAPERLYEALSAISPYMNKGKWPGPLGAQGLRINSRSSQLIDPVKAMITAKYTLPEWNAAPPQDQINEAPRVSFGGALQTEKTAFDINGFQILTNNAQTSDAEMSTFQAGEVEYPRPIGVLRFQRREANDPDALHDEYYGKINSTEMRGKPPHAYMCTLLDGDLSADGTHWVINYEFTKLMKWLRKDRVTGLTADRFVGWDSIVVETDPKTGGPVKDPIWAGDDPESPGGVIVRQVVEDIDFNALRLW